MTTVLIVIGFFIIVALTTYATYLLMRIRKQNQAKIKQQQEQAATAKAKSEELLDSVRYIAAAMIEERCELSEGVMRIAKLFNLVGMSELVSEQYPATFKHFEVIKEHPIKESRTALSKKQRMKLDFARIQSEGELESEILKEAKLLSQFNASALH
ncbi:MULTISPECIES: DUF2489 domain-containing protein [unclassified Shewanella]|uniref:DUF2489 domain-containing protein n=1 Tax=unclassified Shewanella TaxID=196818 RepID=UPI000C7DFF54|nr:MULTISPECIES: DUF2489 domain-containing protein [unclassified Shewanella]PKG57473.1 DUF2489 domain-containing protein [Shewanella sp. GutDb-MelDb]PKG72950.1 DUF2489 domain-containing protein [Shewanella sp. GutCb]